MLTDEAIFFLNKITVSLIIFSVGHLVLIIERYWKRSDLIEKIYSADIRETHHFRICSWVFPFGYVKDKWLVNCGYFTGDCRSIHGMKPDFICSEDEESWFKVIADTLISMEVILFKWWALISLIIFSNIGSGSDFAAIKLLLIQSGSKFSSKDVLDDGFVAAEAIFFRWLSLISFKLFSNVGSGSNILLRISSSY